MSTPRSPSWSRKALALALAFSFPATVSAGPVGEEVVHGEAEFARDGNYTEIHAGDNAIINYQSFNVHSDETVRFVQPGAQARVMNRIMNGQPTQIDGQMFANGTVYFLNEAGLFVGANALIDVAGFVAAAGTLSNEDFLQEVDHFTNLQGPVENLGEIHARFVHLLGAEVANRGSIVAENGIVTMVAGDDVYLSEAGGKLFIKIEGAGKDLGEDVAAVEQAGEIDAGEGQVALKAGDLYSLAIRHPGKTRAHDILLEGGENGVVNVAGMLDASDDTYAAQGGSVDVLGDYVALEGATLDASGDTGGGKIRIGGDRHGQGDVRTATGTFVSDDSSLNADALRAGDGGEVIVWADGVTRSYGEISARGGEESGDGGFVETSGKQALQVSRAPDLSAPNGRGGEWLLDPVNVTIVDDMGSLDPPPGETRKEFTGDMPDSTVSDDAIEDALNMDMMVTISTDFDAGMNNEAGNIVQNADARIDKTAGGDAKLNMFAANNIELNGGIRSTSGKLDVNLVANDAQTSDDRMSGSAILNADITTNGGTVELSGVEIRIAEDIRTEGGNVELNGNTIFEGARQRVDAGDGTIDASGQDLSKTTAGKLFLAAGTEVKARSLTTVDDVQIDTQLVDIEQNVQVGASGEMPTVANLSVFGVDDQAETMMQAGGDIRVTGVAEVFNGDFSSRGNMRSTGGDIVIGRTLAAGDVSARNITAGEDAIAGSLTATRGSVTVGGTADIFNLDEGEEVLGNIEALNNINLGNNPGNGGAPSHRAARMVAGSAGGLTGAGGIDIGGSVQDTTGSLVGDDVRITGSANNIGGSIAARSGAVTIGDLAKVEGEVAAATSISIGNTADIKQSMTAGQAITVGGKATVGGNVQAGGLVSIGADSGSPGGADIEGELLASAVTVAGDAEIGNRDMGEMRNLRAMTGAVLIGGNADVTGSLRAGAGIIINGDARIGTSSDTDTNVENDLIASGGNLSVGGFVDVMGDVEAGGSIDIEGGLPSIGSPGAAIGGNLRADSDVTIAGETRIGGKLESGGDVDLAQSDLSPDPGPALGVINEGIEAGGDLSVAGDLLTTNVDAEGSVSVDGDLIAARVHAGDVSGNPDRVAEETITVGGLATVGSDLIATGDISLHEGVETPREATRIGRELRSTKGDISIAGDVEALLIRSGRGIEVSGALAASQVRAGETDEPGGTSGSITVGATATVAGDMLATGDISLNETDPDVEEGQPVPEKMASTIGGRLVSTNGEITSGADLDARHVESGTGLSVTGVLLADNVSVGDIAAPAGEADDATITIEEHATVTGDMLATGDISLNEFEPEGEGVQKQASEIARRLASINGTITSGADLNGGDVDAGGSIDVAGALQAGNVTAGTTDAAGDIVEETITVEKTATVSGDMIATGDISLNESEPEEGIEKGTNRIDGRLSSTLGEIVSGSDLVGNEIDARELIQISGNLEATNISAGNVGFPGDSEVTLTVDEAATVTGDMLATGDISINEFEPELVEGEPTPEKQTSAVGGRLASINGDITIGADHVGGQVEAGRSVDISGSLVASRVTAGDIDAAPGEAAEESITADEFAVVTGDMIATGEIVLNIPGPPSPGEGQDPPPTQPSMIGGRLASINRGILSAGDLSTGSLEAAQDVTVQGRLDNSGTAQIGRDIVAGELRFGSTGTLGGNMLVQRSIQLDGNLTLNGSEGQSILGGRFPGEQTAELNAQGIQKTTEGFLEIGSPNFAMNITLEGTVDARRGSLGIGPGATRAVQVASLRAQEDVIVYGAANVSGGIQAGRNVELNGATTFNGAGTQLVIAGEELSIQEVEKTTNGTLGLIGDTIQFNGRVESVDGLLLAAQGTGTRPDGANLVQQTGDLQLISQQGDVSMTGGDKLIVENGNLEIQGRTVRLGDVKAANNLRVAGNQIQLLNPRASQQNGGGFEIAPGIQRANIVASTIDFSTSPTGDNQVFATTFGRASLTGDPLLAFEVIPTDPATLLGTDINKEKVELPPVRGDAPPIVQQLIQVASQRPIWADELIAFLDCSGLGHCIPGAPNPARDVRFAAAEVQAAMLRYRQLFQNIGPLRAALQRAVNDYGTSHPRTPISGTLLLRYIQSDPDYLDVAAYLELLGRLFQHFEPINMTPDQRSTARLDVLVKIGLIGLEPEQLIQSVQRPVDPLS